MNEHQEHETGDRSSQAFNSRLKEQIESSLDDVYRFNAATAKYGIVWVWLLRLLTFGTAAGMVFSTIIGTVLLATQTDIDFETREIDPIEQHTWFLWIGAALALTVGFWFFRSILRGVGIAQQTSEKLASEYRRERRY